MITIIIKNRVYYKYHVYNWSIQYLYIEFLTSKMYTCMEVINKKKVFWLTKMT